MNKLPTQPAQCTPVRNNPWQNIDLNNISSSERPRPTHRRQIIDPSEDPPTPGHPNTTPDPDSEKFEFLDDFNKLMINQSDIQRPSPFPFISLKDVESVFGNTYYKLCKSYLLPAKDSTYLPSKLFMLLLTFINHELKTIKSNTWNSGSIF